MNIVAQRLKIAIRNKGITQRDLARRSGVSEGNISHYCKGDWMPKRDKIYRMASVLEVSPAWLIGLDIEEQTISDLFDQLNEENKIEVRNFIQYKLAMQEERLRNV